MKSNRPRYLVSSKFLLVSAIFMALLALAIVPSLSSSASSVSNSKGVPRSVDMAKRSIGAGLSLPGRGLSLTPFVQETIETFAADCTTPQSSFVLGETVCAKTNDVVLNFPGGRWVDWILTGSPNTIVSGSRTTTLITSNPQTFVYTPASIGTYKVEITEDDGAEIKCVNRFAKPGAAGILRCCHSFMMPFVVLCKKVHI